MSNDKNLVLGKDIPLLENTSVGDVSDGFHTFNELYEHRHHLFVLVLNAANYRGLECGWSNRHSDGELCFGGGWNIAWIVDPNSGKEARYHLPVTIELDKSLEKEIGRPWNGKSETIEALKNITVFMKSNKFNIIMHGNNALI
jgi:hypothetical protein